MLWFAEIIVVTCQQINSNSSAIIHHTISRGILQNVDDRLVGLQMLYSENVLKW